MTGRLRRMLSEDDARLLTGLGTLLCLVYLALVPVPRADHHLLSADGAFYYISLRSLVLDRDLRLTNDVEFYNARLPADHPARIDLAFADQFSIGPAVLWLPAFVPAHTLARGLHALGAPVAADGFSLLEEAAVCLASILYVIIGLHLVAAVARRLVPDGRPVVATGAVFLASTAVYYALFEPSMSHSLEFFAVGLFLWLLLACPPRRPSGWWQLGLAVGLMSIVRWQDSLFALLLFARPGGDGERLGPRALVSVAAGVLPVVGLQLAAWQVMHDAAVVVPQGGGFLTVLDSHWFEVLCSTRHGLITWTPIALAGIVGWAFLPSRRLAAGCLIVFLLDLYVCGIARDWWAGDAFGMRRLTGAVPLFVLGVAAVLARVRRRRAERLAWAVLVALILWNGAFMLQYRLGLIPAGEALTCRQIVTEKLLLPLHLVRRLLGESPPPASSR